MLSYVIELFATSLNGSLELVRHVVPRGDVVFKFLGRVFVGLRLQPRILSVGVKNLTTIMHIVDAVLGQPLVVTRFSSKLKEAGRSSRSRTGSGYYFRSLLCFYFFTASYPLFF